jgi:hypothetical protein
MSSRFDRYPIPVQFNTDLKCALFYKGKLVTQVNSLLDLYPYETIKNGTYIFVSGFKEDLWYRQTNGGTWLIHQDHVPKCYRAYMLILS